MDTINSTINATTSIGLNPPSWGGTMLYVGLFIILPLLLIQLLLAVLWNLASYTRFKKYLNWLGDSFRYAILGMISIMILAIPFGFLYWGYTQAKQGNIVPLKYVGYAILTYTVLTVIGYLVNKYVIKRVKNFEKKLKKEK